MTFFTCYSTASSAIGSPAPSLLSEPLRLGHVAEVLICLSAISNPGTNVTQPGKRGAGEDANAGGNL